MKARGSIEGRRRLTPRLSRRAVGASLVAVISLGSLGSAATPSFASSHLRSANGSAYCKLLTAYNKKQTAANRALETPGAAVAAMELAFKNLKAEESIVLGVAPSSLQSSYKTIFKDLGIFYADLSKAHFNYLKLTKAEIAQFQSLSKSMTPASNKITAYNRNVCGVKA
jgi:hypothetical protein